MNVEENRLRTFTDWPANAPVDPNRLAKAGFYYSGHALEVQCFLCGVKISEWNYGDQAIVRHSLAEPNCPFVKNASETCNVPLVPVSANNLSSSTEISESGNIDENRSINACSNTEPQKDYRIMSERLRSFVNWPISNIVSPKKLAKAGFYYLQHNDNVKCAYCGGVLSNWLLYDDPTEEHKKHFPNCDFNLHQDEEDNIAFNETLLPGANAKELGIQCHETAKKLQYSTFEKRLETFNGWPTHLKQTPEMLASAGLYYTGTGDKVVCFNCEGGLRNWEVTDDAWTEHARWFPTCKFVNLMRGQEFIKQCVDTRPDLDPSIFEGVSDENEVASSGNTSSSTVASISPAEVKEQELETLLRSFPATVALGIEFSEDTVRSALRKRMEEVGTAYSDPNELIEDILCSQMEGESTSLQAEIRETLSTELSNSLNRLEREHSNQQSSANQHSDVVKDATSSDKKTTVKKEALSLEEENRKLKEARLCKICMDSEISIVFLPCGHITSCVSCALSLKHCPMCREEIKFTVRAFLS